MSTWEVRYFDNREGELRVIEVEAEDWGEAFDAAAEDYYFGQLISCEEVKS